MAHAKRKRLVRRLKFQSELDLPRAPVVFDACFRPILIEFRWPHRARTQMPRLCNANPVVGGITLNFRTERRPL